MPHGFVAVTRGGLRRSCTRKTDGTFPLASPSALGSALRAGAAEGQRQVIGLRRCGPGPWERRSRGHHARHAPGGLGRGGGRAREGHPRVTTRAAGRYSRSHGERQGRGGLRRPRRPGPARQDHSQEKGCRSVGDRSRRNSRRLRDAPGGTRNQGAKPSRSRRCCGPRIRRPRPISTGAADRLTT